MQQECGPFIKQTAPPHHRLFCQCLTFLDLDADQAERGDASLPAASCQTPGPRVSSQSLVKTKHTQRKKINKNKRSKKIKESHTGVTLPSLVCALVICRSQSPDRSFSLPMICRFSSRSVMCGPSKITVSELSLEENL